MMEGGEWGREKKRTLAHKPGAPDVHNAMEEGL